MSSAEVESLERDAELKRARITSLVDEIKDRLSPGDLMERTLKQISTDSVSDFASAMGRQVRANPLPCALVVFGLAWLIFAPEKKVFGRTKSTDNEALMEPEESTTESGTGHGAKQAVVHAMGTARETFGSTVGKAKHVMDKATVAARSASESVTSFAKSAREETVAGFHDASDSAARFASDFASFVKREPLLAGAAGLSLGAALGTIVPVSPAEARLFGPMGMNDSGSNAEAIKEGAETPHASGERPANERLDLPSS